MKPPTEAALRYASIVLGRDVTQLERLVQGEAPGASRDNLAALLSYVRTVRTWILGVQMPRAQRREAKLFALARTAPPPDRKQCTECGELMAFDHSVCFYCATGTRPAASCSDCGATLCQVVGPDVRGAVCPECNADSALFDEAHEPDCRCSYCGAEPLSPRDLRLLKTSVVGLIPRQK